MPVVVLLSVELPAMEAEMVPERRSVVPMVTEPFVAAESTRLPPARMSVPRLALMP